MRRRIKFLALAVALGITTITLTQCRLVSDNVTGVDLGNGRLSGRTTCVKQCNENFKAAQKAEDDRHKAAEKVCGGSKTCKDAEKAKHDAAQDQIEADKKNCKK